MYIDEIKKLLKDIEKTIQGDRRWLENDDYKIKNKMKEMIDIKRDYKQPTSIPLYIPNNFAFPNYERKNNFISNVSNFVTKENKPLETIKLPSSVITPRRMSDTRTLKPDSATNNIREIDSQYLDSNIIDNTKELRIKNYSNSINFTNVKGSGKVTIVIDKDTILTNLPSKCDIEIVKPVRVNIPIVNLDKINRIKVISEVNPRFILNNYSSDQLLKLVGKIICILKYQKGGSSSLTKKACYKIELETDSNIEIPADEIDYYEFKGNGQVVITNLERDVNADLTKISTKKPLIIKTDETVEFNGKIPSNSIIDLGENASFTSSVDKIKNVQIRGKGQVIVTNLEKDLNADLTKISTSKPLIVKTDKSITFNGKIPKKAKVELNNNATFTSSADKIDGVEITGYGRLNATDKEKSPNAKIIDKTDRIPKIKSTTVTLRDGEILRVTASEANGKTYVGDGKVIITDLESSPNADLSRIFTTKGGELEVGKSVEFGGKINKNTSIKINESATLKIPEYMASGISITGGTVDLIKKESEFEDKITSKRPIPSKERVLKDGEVLTLTAKEADGMKITGNGTVIITDLESNPNANLSGIQNNGNKIINVNDDMEFKGELPLDSTINVMDGKNFKISASKADGQTITGNGNVEIKDLTETADLSQVKNKGSKKIVVDKDLDFNGKLPKDTMIEVQEDKEFTVKAEEASGNSIIGNGKSKITNLEDSPYADLSKVETGGGISIPITEDTNFKGTLPEKSKLDVSEDKKLILTAENANEKEISGNGKTIITDLNDSNADLSKIKTEGGNILKVLDDTKFNGRLPPEPKLIGDTTKKFSINEEEIPVTQSFDSSQFERKYNIELDKLTKNVEGLGEQIISALGNFT